MLNGTVSSGPGLATCVVGSVSTSDVANVLVSPTWVSWASCVDVLVLLAIYLSRSRRRGRSRFGNFLVLALSLTFALSPILSWMASGIGCSSVAVEHGSDKLQDKAVGLPAGISSWHGSCGSLIDIPDAAIVVWFLIVGCLMGGSLLWSGRRQADKPGRSISERIAAIFAASVGVAAIAALFHSALIPTLAATNSCADLDLIRWWSGPGGFVCVMPDTTANSGSQGFLPALVVDRGGSTLAGMFAIAIAMASFFQIKSFKHTTGLWLLVAALSIPAGLVADAYDSYDSCRAGEFTMLGGGSAMSIANQDGLMKATCEIPTPAGLAAISLWGPVQLTICAISMAIALGLAIVIARLPGAGYCDP